MSNDRLKVLLVPDSVHWVTGTIAKSIARFNPWLEATIASGPAINVILAEHPELMRNFDLVHFICPYASRAWLPRFRELVPCVTSHHHVTNWDIVKHNAEGDAIMAVSGEWALDLQARGADPSKIFIVPYGIDSDLFKPVTDEARADIRSKLGVSESSILIGFFGKRSSNDEDRKGTDVFANALVALKERLSDFVVLIVGPGWHRLVNSLTSSGVKCIWLPYIHNFEGLAEMYQALDFYWVTARVEGGPATLFEAMSTEVCCLTTPVGIAREIVRDADNGVLLPFDDAAAFADRTASLAVDVRGRKRLGRNARQTILSEMHVPVTAARVREVYAKAYENFAERRQCALPLDVNDIAESAGGSAAPALRNGNEVPLNGFPKAVRGRVRMLENLSWSEQLIYQRQWSEALRLILTAWLGNPLSILPARTLLRRFLPAPVVAWIVRLKHAVSAPTRQANARH